MRLIPTLDVQQLKSIPLPNHGGRYATIPYSSIVDEVYKQAAANNIVITESIYRSTAGGNIATGQYFLNYGNDPDIKLMFAWTNSYNKMRKFSCGIGTYVTVCLNGMLSANYNSFARKHTGDAYQEMVSNISEQFAQIAPIFQKMVDDKNKMIDKQVTENEVHELLGKLFMEDVIGAVQLGIVKQQIKKSDYTYSGESDSLWHVYNHITHALKSEHPISFDKAHQDLHSIVVDNFFGTAQTAVITAPQITETEVLEYSAPQVLEMTEEETEELALWDNTSADGIEEITFEQPAEEELVVNVIEDVIEPLELDIKKDDEEDSFESWLNL